MPANCSLWNSGFSSDLFCSVANAPWCRSRHSSGSKEVEMLRLCQHIFLQCHNKFSPSRSTIATCPYEYLAVPRSASDTTGIPNNGSFTGLITVFGIYFDSDPCRIRVRVEIESLSKTPGESL